MADDLHPPARIRPARPEDVATLNRIARVAKASWGYTPAQLEAWSAELEVTPDSLRWGFTFVVETGGEVVAFAQISSQSAPWELQALWVMPQHMRRGYGRALLRHAASHAAHREQSILAIDSDPNAEAFYRQCGARLVGRVPAPIDGEPDRQRPQLVLATSKAAADPARPGHDAATQGPA